MKYQIFLFVIYSVFIFSAYAEKRPPYADGIESGIKLFEAGKYQLAANEFKAVLNKYPNNAVAGYNLGLTQYRQKQYPEAIESFNLATESKNYYGQPASYYKAIAYLNLGETAQALKIAKNYQQKGFIGERMAELTTAIEAGTDSNFENAKAAEQEANYELCLLELEESLFSDTKTGRELSTLCLNEMYGRKADRRDTYFKLYFDSQVSQSDNIYEKDTNVATKSIYFAEVGGEYLNRNTVDWGFGASYNYLNGIDLPNMKRETYNVSLPFNLRRSGYSIGLTPYYELTKIVAVDSYSAAGASFQFTVVERKNYVYGLLGKAEHRVSLASANDYMAGSYGQGKIFYTKYFGDLNVNLNVSLENTATGDQPIGPFFIPAANETRTYGLGFGYDFTESSSLNLRASFSDKWFSHIVSPLGTERKDQARRWSATYYYKINDYVRTFLQYSQTHNKSTYDATEIINRNFKENLTSFGLSLLVF